MSASDDFRRAWERRELIAEADELADVQDAADAHRAAQRGRPLVAGGADAGKGSEPATDLVIRTTDEYGFRVDHVIPAHLVERQRRRERRRLHN